MLWNVSYSLHTISIPSSCGIFVYKLETSIATKIVSWPIFVFSIKLMKSVVSFPKPLNFSTLVNQPVRISHSEDSTAPTEIRGTVLFQSGAVLVVKHDHIRDVSTNGPFFIGCVETDVTDNDENSCLISKSMSQP